jgi:hypothetical protein
MLKASDILGYPLDLTNFPVSPSSISSVKDIFSLKKVLYDWEKILINSDYFKKYILELLKSIRYFDDITFSTNLDSNEFVFALFLISEEFYEICLKICFDIDTVLTDQSGKINLIDNDCTVYLVGELDKEVAIFTNLNLSQIDLLETFEWEWAY